jgi:Xaa-Pro aminopeptidase
LPDSRDATAGAAAPFDTARLDALMAEAGLDVLVATSKHNVQYLLGGYKFQFFSVMDAIGTSRYLPVFVYFRGDAGRSAYVANAMESWERELGRFWLKDVVPAAWGTADSVELAVDRIRASGLPAARIGVEMPFLPADALRQLEAAFGRSAIGDAVVVLERLRAVKTPAELALVREASERVVEAMLAVFRAARPGITKRQLVEALRREETDRGLTFEYCLLTVNTGLNRAASDEGWKKGGVASLDSGGNYHGYIGDLCRMAILGAAPDQELVDLLAEIEAIQQAARKPIRPGALGREIIEAGEAERRRQPNGKAMAFVAHGIGLVSHEAPRLTASGPVPYPADDAGRPLAEGMVVSIETTLPHPTRGFIKLEDTVAVTATGCIGYGDGGRGWTVAG